LFDNTSIVLFLVAVAAADDDDDNIVVKLTIEDEQTFCEHFCKETT
jgi:hypothetical protein